MCGDDCDGAVWGVLGCCEAGEGEGGEDKPADSCTMCISRGKYSPLMVCSLGVWKWNCLSSKLRSLAFVCSVACEERRDVRLATYNGVGAFALHHNFNRSTDVFKLSGFDVGDRDGESAGGDEGCGCVGYVDGGLLLAACAEGIFGR